MIERMKKILGLTILLSFTLLFSCEKYNVWNLKKLPEISAPRAISNDLQGVAIQSDVLSNGHDKISRSGFCWSDANQEPTLVDNVLLATPNNNKLNGEINWTVNNWIYVRAFVENSIGIVYSDVTVVFWPGGTENLPVVQTVGLSDPGFFTLTATGSLISDGGLPVTEKGFCFSKTNQSPTIADLTIQTSGNYTATLQGLTENSTYYVRAYAKNFQGVGYGTVMQLNTLNYYQPGEPGPAGGLIFYSKSDTSGGWNFLEAAPTDYAASQVWLPVSTITGVTSTALGDGLTNTLSIFNQYGSSGIYASLTALNYNYNGYFEWFLPSRDELLQMRQNLFLNGIGSFSSGLYYWSSSEDANFSSNAWAVNMSSGSTVTHPKSSTFRVRPIRRF
jgi:hypothetical protein